jgi:hypothetical protein
MNADIVLGAAVAASAVVLPEVGSGPRCGVLGFEAEPPAALYEGVCIRYE